MINIFRFLKLTYQDLKDNDKKKFIGGFIIYVNPMGSGKTISLVREAYKYHLQGYKVYSNFFMTFQDGQLNSWKDIIKVPPNSILCLDEISDLFNAREWKSMPKSIFTYIINSRKMNIRVLATAQEFDEIDKTIRTKCTYVAECNCFGRYHSIKYYRRLIFQLGLGSKKRRPSQKDSFIAEDELRNMYDTNEIVENLFKTEELN